MSEENMLTNGEVDKAIAELETMLRGQIRKDEDLRAPGRIAGLWSDHKALLEIKAAGIK